MKPISFYRLQFFALVIFLIGASCNNDSASKEKDPETGTTPKPEQDSLPTTLFTVIGDVPYGEDQRQGLDSLITLHNQKAESAFVFHVGDIKRGGDPCDEDVYTDVAAQLKRFTTPTFIIPGDNEYNDCDAPEQGFAYWKEHFLNFHENWDFDHQIVAQTERPENMMWTQNKILFLGLNLVGSQVHDETEWETRLTQNAQWTKKHFEAQKDSVSAAVVFGHANMVEGGAAKFETFVIPFRTVSANFDKPILYLQGDGHFWLVSRPYAEKNILRVQIDGGPTAVQVTVDPNKESPFAFDKGFLD